MRTVRYALRGYGGDDRYLICEELSKLLQEEGRTALMDEYGDYGTEED